LITRLKFGFSGQMLAVWAVLLNIVLPLGWTQIAAATTPFGGAETLCLSSAHGSSGLPGDPDNPESHASCKACPLPISHGAAPADTAIISALEIPRSEAPKARAEALTRSNATASATIRGPPTLLC